MAAVKIYRGDTWQRAWVLKDASGAPLDLTGASSASQKVLPAT